MNVAWKTPWGDAKSPYQLTGTVQADSGKKYAYTLRVTRAEDGTDDSDEQRESSGPNCNGGLIQTNPNEFF